MKYDIFFPLFRNIVRLRKLSLERYNWNIEMKVLELNCEIDTFIKYINKKKTIIDDFCVKLKEISI